MAAAARLSEMDIRLFTRRCALEPELRNVAMHMAAMLGMLRSGLATRSKVTLLSCGKRDLLRSAVVGLMGINCSINAVVNTVYAHMICIFIYLNK